MINEQPKKERHYTIKIPITIKATSTFESISQAEETKRYVIEKTGLTATMEREEKKE